MAHSLAQQDRIRPHHIHLETSRMIAPTGLPRTASHMNAHELTTPNESAPQDHTLWTVRDIQAHLEVGRSLAYELTRRADFPPAVVLSRKALRWPRIEVLGWVERQRAQTAPVASPARRRSTTVARTTVARTAGGRTVTRG